MLDINEALMRRVKPPTPLKRKRTPLTQKKSNVFSTASKTAGSAGAGLLKFSRPLDELSEPSAKKAKPVPAPASGGTSSLSPSDASRTSFESPQASAPTRQAYIDLGQRDFGRHATCRKCGLLYTVGEEEDEKEHRRFCRDRQRGITVPKWKNERVLKAFPDDGARIIEIRADDAPLHVKKLLEVKDVLDDALGFVEPDVFLQRGNFLFVQSKQLVGCVTVERISKAVALAHDSSSLASAPTESDEVAAAVLGICQLWVHPQHRGKRVATRLVDVVREKFIYGMHIAKSRVAFSQPTRNGLAFATRYVAPHRVLVYGATEPSTTTTPSTATSTGVDAVAAPAAKRTLLP